VTTPHGLDKFELEDRDSILKEALAIQAIAIPSHTFQKLYATKLAFALVGNIPNETQETIREEVDHAIEHEGGLLSVLNHLDAEQDDDPGGGSPPRTGGGRSSGASPGSRKAKSSRAPPRREARA
jgi:hypothetical protein